MFSEAFAKKLENYLTDVARTGSDREAWDRQFGDGAWDRMAGLVYDLLRAKAAT